MLDPQRKQQIDSLVNQYKASNNTSTTLSPERKSQIDNLASRYKNQSNYNTGSTENSGFKLSDLVQPLVDAGKFVVGSVQTVPAAVKAISKGATPQSLQEFNQTFQNSAYNDQQKQAVASQNVSEPIKYGTKLGAGVASYLVPSAPAKSLGLLGKAATRAVEGGLSGSLQGVYNGENINPADISSGTLFGAGAGFLSPILGSVFRKTAGNLADRSAVAGLGSPNKLKKIIGLNKGDSLYNLINENNLWDRLPTSARDALSKVDSSYKAAISGSKSIPKLSAVVKDFDDAISKLEPLAVQSEAVASQIDELANRRNAFIKDIGKFNVSASDINKGRAATFADLTNADFSPTSGLKGTSAGTKQAYGIFKKNLGDVAPDTVKLGRNEAALRTLTDVFDQYQARGLGGKLISVGKLGGAGVGSVLAGIPGAIGGYLIETLTNSPVGSKILAKTFNSLSKAETDYLNKILRSVPTAVATGVFLRDRNAQR